MSFQIQQKIKQNALQMRQYMTDLYDWQQQMELKQKAKAQIRKQQQSKIKQAESKIIKKQSDVPQNKPVKAQKKLDLVRDVNTVSDYYKAWDKFDADQQLNKLQEEQKRAYRPYNPYQESKNNLRAKPKTRMNIQGRRNIISDPTQLKDKGNLHFQNLQFQKAIKCYTQCLEKLDREAVPIEQQTTAQKKLRCVVLSNRSMAYLKNQQTVKALQDANLSLNYDDKYSKSYYRRAECLKKLGKYKQSLADFKKVRTLEPSQTKADAQIKKIQAFLAKRYKQARQSLVTQYSPNLLIGSNSRRIQIKQLQQFQSKLQKTNKSLRPNYLQEL